MDERRAQTAHSSRNQEERAPGRLDWLDGQVPWFSRTRAEDLLTEADVQATVLAAQLHKPASGHVQKTISGGIRIFVIAEPDPPPQFGYRWGDHRDAWRFRDH